MPMSAGGGVKPLDEEGKPPHRQLSPLTMVLAARAAGATVGRDQSRQSAASRRS